MMHAGMMAALIVSGVAGTGMVANEASHGQVADMMGMGHNHMADYGGYHCASHTGEHGADHQQHMHNDTHTPHDGCPGASGMHNMGGMGNA